MTSLTDDRPITHREVKERLFKFEQENLQLWSYIAALKDTLDLHRTAIAGLSRAVYPESVDLKLKLPKPPETKA